MSTPHRGLPPPSAMTLPDPGRPPPPFTGMPGSMPPPPPQWQGHEESMRSYLAAKTEEDKRKQEEERTRQENYRLEQRRIEQSMLSQSLNAGIPPSMVPMIYAGIGASGLGHVNYDLLQQYFAQLQTTQQQLQQQPSPELRRETRLIGQGAGQGYIPAQQVVPSQHTEQPQPPPLQTTFSAYQGPPTRPPPTSVPRSATHTSLPRLTTNEISIYQPPQQGPSSAHPLQQSQTIQQDNTASSPALYFHHWQPPSESKSTQPQTPASKGEPLSAHPGSHLSESDYKESPRKRKAQGPHQPAPPPTGTMHTSPSFSAASSTGSGRRAGHVRSRSNTSARESDSRPDSRREMDPPRSSQPESAPPSEEQPPLREVPPLPQGESSTSRLSAEPPREYRAERPQSRGSR